MEIVVKGRNVEVPEHFRVFVADKLARSERYDSKIIRVDVELSHEANPRQHKNRQRVQITLASKGPAVRAEASAESFYAALDTAVTRLETRLSRAAQRRQDRNHSRTTIASVIAEPTVESEEEVTAPAESAPTELVETETRWQDDGYGDSLDGEPGRIVRIKNHPAEPITVDQALLRMELVGHDFYLFKDVDTGMCSVVYRRRGFNYGLLRLAEADHPTAREAAEVFAAAQER